MTPLTTELSRIAGVAVKVREPLARYTSFKVGGPRTISSRRKRAPA